jgi:hypothetical protein
MNRSFAARLSRLPKLGEHELGRPHFKVRNPIVQGMGEAIIQPSYDYYETVQGAPTTRQLLFTIPQGSQYTPAGGAAFSKTAYHTDLTQSGVLAAPNKLLVRALCGWWHPQIFPADATAFADNAMVFFQVNQKPYLNIQFGKLPMGGGVFVSGTLNTVNGTSNGYPDAANLYLITEGEILGVQIEQQQNFGVTLDPTLTATGVGFTATTTANGGLNIKVHMYLEGVLLRAVQ